MTNQARAHTCHLQLRVQLKLTSRQALEVLCITSTRQLVKQCHVACIRRDIRRSSQMSARCDSVPCLRFAQQAMVCEVDGPPMASCHQTAAAPHVSAAPGEVPQQAHSLLHLPRDVQLCILARCGTSDLAAVAVTCSRLRSLARTDELWRPAAEHANAGKPALAELFRAVIADAHWLRRSPSAPCGPETKSCAPAAAVHATAAAAAQWGSADGGEWLLTRNGTRLREWRRSCFQAASVVPSMSCSRSHAPV